MASKAKWKRRYNRMALQAQDSYRLVEQYKRANEELTTVMEFHRERANALQQAPVLTDEQKVDVEGAYQRGLEAGRAQNVELAALERAAGLAFGPALSSMAELERLTSAAGAKLNDAYFAVCELFKLKPDEDVKEPSLADDVAAGLHDEPHP
jgi:NAD-specific glutamate dehydrogenase